MIKVSVPATSANLGPGFDTLGVALELRNIIEMDETGIDDVIIEIEGHEGALERPENNLVYLAAVRVFERLEYRPHGLLIREEVGIPVARGLGSSAACIVGGIAAANALVRKMSGRSLSDDEMLQMAVAMEGHPDNVTPAMVGGFTVSCMDEERGSLHVRFDPPRGLQAVIVIPEVPIAAGAKTAKSRGVLPTEVSLKDAVYNLNRTALLVAALAQGRVDLLSVATQDRLHQPYRASLVPGLRSVFQAALDAGARGAALSGAGPSVIAFVDQDPEPVVLAMEGAFQWAGSEARSLVVGLAREGVRVFGGPDRPQELPNRAPYWG